LLNILSDINFISAGLGSVIGGIFVLLGTLIAYWLDRRKSASQKKEETLALIKAIKVEIETLFDIYMKNVGNTLEEHTKGEPFLFKFEVTQEYFTVYTSSANRLGDIEENLRSAIIKTYNLGRSLVDTYKTNNSLIEKYNYNLWLYNVANQNVFEQTSNWLFEDLKKYADSLKISHDKFKESYNKFYEIIETSGID